MRRKFIEEFGSIEAIKAASDQELSDVGISKQVIDNIRQFFRFNMLIR